MQQVKTYASFMNDITPSEVYEGLLAYGMFAEQLPPIFTGKPFYDYCESEKPSFPNKHANYVFYENMRNINVPRPLGIPNPAAYQRLCKCIADNWDNLQEHFISITDSHEHIISRIHIRKMENKPHLFEMNYKNWHVDGTPEPDLLIGAKFLVKADISNCFPSIYSHAIPWALVGKEEAKLNQREQNKWYNKIDLFTRNVNNNETHGLLIGPHTSNLLSEIILTKIDQHLYDAKWKYTRSIDDYTCYVDSNEKGQLFLVQLNEQLRHYGLTLNHKKSSIEALPAAAVEQWVRRINAFTAFDMKKNMDYKEAQAYLDLAIDLMRENEANSAVLKYAIKVLSSKELTKNAREYCAKSILHLTLIYPYLVTLLEKYVFAAYSVDANQISDFTRKLLATGMSYCNYEAASYAVYYAILYGFTLEGIDFNDIKNSNHCVFMLLGYLYHKNKKNNAQLKQFKCYAETLMKDDMSANWLFVYEALPQSKLKDYWKHMRKYGVSFLLLEEV